MRYDVRREIWLVHYLDHSTPELSVFFSREEADQQARRRTSYVTGPYVLEAPANAGPDDPVCGAV